MSMARAGWFNRSWRDGVLALVGLLTIGVALYFWWHVPAERAMKLRLTAGRSQGERHKIAEMLRRSAVARKLELSIVETAGSVAAIESIEKGKADIAFIQGGFDLSEHSLLRQVASLHVEPLHLLVKEEIYQDVATHLSALHNKRVGLSDPGSGTNVLARELLAFAGLEASDYRADERNAFDLEREKDRSKLPDAIFIVSTMPSPVARSLVARHGFRLVELPFHEAFVLGAIDRELDRDTPSVAAKLKIDRQHVFAAQIPAFTYEVEPGVPPKPLATIGTRMLVIAHKDVASEAIQRILDLVFAPTFSQMIHQTINKKSIEQAPEMPWHDGMLEYQKRNAPVIAGDVLDLVEKEISIFGALIGGVFFLAQWVRRRYMRRRDRGFQSYILPVNSIEREAMTLERGATLDLGTLLELQERLSELKSEALRKFAAGELEGEELMSGFLTHVDNTRDYLTRMILHERELIEKLARVQGRQSPELWREAVEGGNPEVTPVGG